MSKIRNIQKLIFIIPLFLIFLSSSTFVLIQYYENKKDYENSLKLAKAKFLETEKQKLSSIFVSINSYIKFKKASSINIIKNKIKSKVEFAQDLLVKKNKQDLINSLNLKSNKGRYIIFDKNSIENEKLNEEFIFKYEKLIKDKDEGFIFFNSSNNSSLNEKEYIKISYIKIIDNTVLAYEANLDDFETITKKEVLNRLNLMQVNKNSNIFTLDDKLNILQFSKKQDYKSKNFTFLENSEEILFDLKQYFAKSKIDLQKDKYKFLHKEIDNNTYKFYIFSYVKNWDWIISIRTSILDINKKVALINKDLEQKYEETIQNLILTYLLVLIFVSSISLYISYKVNALFIKYKNKIQAQKNALRNINATLELSLNEKTSQLEDLNEKLESKYTKEVIKNRQEDQLIFNKSKMSSMVEIIGNIAHQWRQPLNTISTVSSVNSLKLDFSKLSKNDLKKDLDKIVDTTMYLSNTIEDFKNFFVQTKKIEKFDIVDVLEKNLSLINASMQNSYITIVKNYNKVEVSSLKNELLQAVSNILSNARDALVLQEKDKRVLVIDIYKDEKNAVILIKDSANGIKKDLKDKIFNVNFTTKAKELGSGIGLYLTRQIVQNHLNGEIEVSNEEFVIDEQIYYGACFKISIPLELN